MRTRIIRALAVVGVLAACVPVDEMPSLRRVAVGRTGGGQVVVLFVPCRGDRVDGVEVFAYPDGDRLPDATIWSIERVGTTVGATEFVVGETPTAYDEHVEFSGLPSDQSTRLSVVVTPADDEPIEKRFHVGELTVDRWKVSETETVSRQEFEADAADSCD